METKDSVLAALFACLVVLAKTCLFVLTPLFLDSLSPSSTVIYNVSTAPLAGNSTYSHWLNSTECSKRSLDPFSGIALSAGVSGQYIPYIDYVKPIPSWVRIDPLFGIWFSMGFDTLLLGCIVLYLRFFTERITERETSYPKFPMMLSGCFQAIAALMYQFSTSGSRTAPYLQGALGYFFIPITFILR